MKEPLIKSLKKLDCFWKLGIDSYLTNRPNCNWERVAVDKTDVIESRFSFLNILESELHQRPQESLDLQK